MPLFLGNNDKRRKPLKRKVLAITMAKFSVHVDVITPQISLRPHHHNPLIHYTIHHHHHQHHYINGALSASAAIAVNGDQRGIICPWRIQLSREGSERGKLLLPHYLRPPPPPQPPPPRSRGAFRVPAVAVKVGYARYYLSLADPAFT